jgi:hypothetical protein
LNPKNWKHYRRMDCLPLAYTTPKDATTKLAIAYNEASEKAIADGCNVAAGTLDNMIDSAIVEHGLPKGCIKKAAIILG